MTMNLKPKTKRKKFPTKHKKHKDVSLLWRGLVRAGAVGFLFSTIAYGLIDGGHITNPNSPLFNVRGKIAAEFGYAAQDIRIAGLKRERPAAVLNAIGVRPNDSLIGFNPRDAKKILEKVDWVQKAEVRRIYPNQLEIDIVERVPYAIWQRDGDFYVIDKTGAAFTSIEPRDVKGLMLITGAGAQEKVFDLVNHMEVHAGLKSKIVAAGRIGKRRWNLYLTNGVKVLLPEDDKGHDGQKDGLAKGLDRFTRFSKSLDLDNKAVASVDFRFEGRVIVSPLKTKKDRVKISQR